MVFQGCSDVAESRVEQAILDAESRRDAAFTSDSKLAPARWPLGTRGLLTTTRRGEPALSIDEFSDLSIDHTIATGELAGVTKIDNCTIGDGGCGPMTRRLSQLYAEFWS
jgi:hypothetical protein